MRFFYWMPVALACGCAISGPETSIVDDETIADDPAEKSDAPVAEGKKSECDRSPYNCKLPTDTKNRNRIFNEATKSYYWPLDENTPMVDGLGNLRGYVANTKVKINYGGRKDIDGQSHIYAFAVKLDTGYYASSWIAESSLDQAPVPMPAVNGKVPSKGDYQAVWTVTGGDPNMYGDLKVVKGSTSNNEAASDYLLRTGGVINLLYNLPGMGGVSTDTFPQGVKFLRSRGVPELGIALYPKGSTQKVGEMKFVYGHVGERYGWIARDALVQDPAPSGQQGYGQCYVRCCDSTLVGPIATEGAGTCHEVSKGACAAHEYVLRSRFDEALVYERPKACWAKCENREKYHALDGVTQGCTEVASNWCDAGDRGGLEDAMWSQCRP